MDRHAGFAAAIAIRQETLQDLIRTVHRSGLIPNTLEGTLGNLSASLFVDIPQVICRVANGNQLEVNLIARGSLTITPEGGSPEMRTVRVRARILAAADLQIQDSSILLRTEGLSATLSSLSIEVLAGGPYSPAAQAIIDSPQFFNRVQLALRVQLAGLPSLIPPLSVSFLGDIVTTNPSVTSRVLDGIFAIGLDVNNVAGVTTNGDPNLLTDITAGNDIAMWTSPAAVPASMKTARDKLQQKVTDAGGTLTSMSFEVHEGRLHMAGHIDKGSEGSLDFSLDALPRLIRPGYTEEWDEEYGEHFVITTPSREELWFEVANEVVDIHRPWWLYVLSFLGAVLTFGIGTLIIEAIVNMMRNNVLAQIANSGESAARVREFTFAGTDSPIFRLKLETYECHEEGIFVGITLRPQIPAPKLTGRAMIAIEEAIGTTLKYRVTLPFDVRQADPMLFIRWTVRRTDTNAVVINQDQLASAGLELDLTNNPLLLEVPSLTIACRVYHQLGGEAVDQFNATITLEIRDRLDRSRPFVRWRHRVFTPQVRIEPDGSRTQLGYNDIERFSNIHRTAFPGRCKMASQFSAKVRATDDGSGTEHLDYLDALPFPHDQIVPRRAVLCDYCFFGGPTKTVPLI